jgi:hypothetical protein
MKPKRSPTAKPCQGSPRSAIGSRWASNAQGSGVSKSKRKMAVYKPFSVRRKGRFVGV